MSRPVGRPPESVLAFLAVFFIGCVVGVAVQAFIENSPVAAPRPAAVQKTAAVITPAAAAEAPAPAETASVSAAPVEPGAPLTKKLVKTVPVTGEHVAIARSFETNAR